VFAGGDAVTGTTFIVDAIAAGHRAAHSIGDYLVAGQISHLTYGNAPVAKINPDEVNFRLTLQPSLATPRSEFIKRPAVERINFGKYTQGLGSGGPSQRPLSAL
jgi:hypothetical protein